MLGFDAAYDVDSGWCPLPPPGVTFYWDGVTRWPDGSPFWTCEPPKQSLAAVRVEACPDCGQRVCPTCGAVLPEENERPRYAVPETTAGLLTGGN